MQESRFPISVVERDTGIGRDTLRVWERRYGFPSPERNSKGERVYRADEIRRLQLIRRLIDQGLRPGRLVPLSEEQLNDLAQSLPATSSPVAAEEEGIEELIGLAADAELSALSQELDQRLARDGMRAFVLGTFAPLVRTVGERWAGGSLEIYQEHLLTRHLVGFMDVAMNRLGRPHGKPSVVLATLPGEPHSLGLLMVEALLWCADTATLNLGAEVPMDQITAVAGRQGVDTVAISFSAGYPRGAVRAHIKELAERLPPGVTVWVGGEGAHRLRRLPQSVVEKSLQSL